MPSSRSLAVAALALIAGACAQGHLEWQEPETNRLLTGPYVLLTGKDTALVGFRTAFTADAEVVWKTESGQRGSARASRDGGLFSAKLQRLPRGPVIEYDVMIHGKSAAVGKFRAGTAPDEREIRFAAFGDSRNGHEVHRQIVLAIAREKIDFVLNTGDMVQNGGRIEEWTTFFQIERPLLAQVPIIPTTGNHDLNGRELYDRFFFLAKWSPQGRRYFATDWGNLRMIAIDNGIECNRSCAQFEYVRNELAAGAAQGKLMVMFLHHSPYSSGVHGVNEGVARAVNELARTYGVELVISGHDHNYERTKPIDGTTYIVTGSAGAPIRPVDPQEFSASARTEPHYVLVDVDGDRISTRAVNLKGEVFDHSVIEPNPPRP
jgi:acid phosphatase type 7